MGKSKPSVIMLFGNKEVGKTTSANYLVMWLAQNSYFLSDKIGFADPIKEIALAFGMPFDLVHGTADEKNSLTEWKWDEITYPPPGKSGLMTIREFLQFVGTDVFRKHFHPKTWDKLFWSKILAGLEDNQDRIYICHDGRHHSEMEVPPQLQEQTYKILIKRNTGHQDSHSSEKQLHEMPDELFDHIIINDGTKQELFDKLGGVMESLYM